MKRDKQSIEKIISRQNSDELAREYSKHNMLVIDQFLPPELVKEVFLPEVEKCTQYIHRAYIPKFKKSGSVSYNLVKEHAPSLADLYHSEEMRKFISNIVGREVVICPPEDPHAAALYNYTEPGDYIGVHYDRSFYKGSRFTVLLGLIQESENSKLVCYPGATKLNQRKNPTPIATKPGTLVVFDDKLWHEVTPLGKNERRVILTLEFLTDQRMSIFSRFISNLKDRLLYFGK